MHRYLSVCYRYVCNVQARPQGPVRGKLRTKRRAGLLSLKVTRAKPKKVQAEPSGKTPEDITVSEPIVEETRFPPPAPVLWPSTVEALMVIPTAGTSTSSPHATAGVDESGPPKEVDRSASTLMTIEESTGTLKKAESEYKGRRSLLMRMRNLLSTMQRQDVIDRFNRKIPTVDTHLGFLFFSCAVLYVVSKLIGILYLQRQVTAAIKAGMAGRPEIGREAVKDGINAAAQVYHDNTVPHAEVPIFERPMHDEL
ncbi:hypothetical protein Dsin_019567 [Dipteronia sinensis]|uniref:Sec20 C-terminal domain-containing protein n=1 Tax=Dipteronia sinensis TaxID=43782 RepID=A0AAE0A7M4_9ROSI|nr:hypothetical protein Dsin_019567 [Dipteronia sinensis]